MFNNTVFKYFKFITKIINPILREKFFFVCDIFFIIRKDARRKQNRVIGLRQLQSMLQILR